MQRALSTIVLLGLLLASAAAFAITEHFKLVKSPIYATQVTKLIAPVCRCPSGQAEIRFSMRRVDSVTVTIIDSAGHEVATVMAEVPVPKGLNHFFWNGHTSAGKVAPEGIYQPEITFSNGRTIVMPNRITVDTTVPKVISASDGNRPLIAGGHHAIAIHYVFDGRARAHVYLGGRSVIVGRHKLPRGAVKWNGKVGGKALPPGRYVLEVAAVDKAGNETAPAERKRVAVRISAIALSANSIHVAPGARFTVVVHTAAQRYRWKLAGKRGSETKKRLHLRAPSRRGHYRLVVSAGGHSTGARVIVGKK